MQRRRQVDPVEQGPAQPARMAEQFRVPARAPLALGCVAARARVGRSDEHEAGRVDGAMAGAGDHDPPLLEGLAQRLESRSRELRELVE